MPLRYAAMLMLIIADDIDMILFIAAMMSFFDAASFIDAAAIIEMPSFSMPLIDDDAVTPFLSFAADTLQLFFAITTDAASHC